MKVNQGLPTQGSFGLPPEMREKVAEFQAARVRAEAGEEEPADMLAEDEIAEQEKGEEKKETQDSDKFDVTPIESLSKIGVELTDEDYQRIIFRGFLEKQIVVVPSIRGTKPLVAIFKTLTGEEVDAADELLAEEIRERQMTNDGYQTRRSMWILAYGVTQLMGKPICQPVMVKGKVDEKETAKEKRKVLSKLSPSILTKMMHIQGVYTMAINAIIADPEADYLKKS